MSTALQTLILAGGQSRRMGQDKALLPLANTTLLQRTVDIATGINAPRHSPVWIVTPWRDGYQSVFSEQVQWLDDPHQQGGLMAFHHALGEIPRIPGDEWVLLLACDLPYLNLAQLQTWWSVVQALPGEYNAALVQRENIYEPLCGFYRKTVKNSLAHFCQKGGRSFQKWLATESVYELSLGEEQMLFNCNTPGDFATLRANTPAD